MGVFEQFPYTNFHDLNLDWILNLIKKLDKEMDDFQAINTITYADPFQWNIKTGYPIFTMVGDADTGIVYLSRKVVPAGIPLVNTDYWTPIFNLQTLEDNLYKVMESIAPLNQKNNTIAQQNIIKNELFWMQHKLYICTDNIYVRDTIIPDTNCRIVTIEEMLLQAQTYLTTRINSNADNIEALQADTKNLQDQVTDNNTNVNNRIDNIVGQAGESNTEIVDARIGVFNETFNTLENRLNSDFNNAFTKLKDGWSLQAVAPSQITRDSLINSDGSVISQGGYFVAEYPCTDGDLFHYEGYFEPTAPFAVYAIYKNGVLLNAYTGNNQNETIDVRITGGATSIKFCFETQYGGTDKGDTAWPYVQKYLPNLGGINTHEVLDSSLNEKHLINAENTIQESDSIDLYTFDVTPGDVLYITVPWDDKTAYSPVIHCSSNNIQFNQQKIQKISNFMTVIPAGATKLYINVVHGLIPTVIKEYESTSSYKKMKLWYSDDVRGYVIAFKQNSAYDTEYVFRKDENNNFGLAQIFHIPNTKKDTIYKPAYSGEYQFFINNSEWLSPYIVTANTTPEGALTGYSSFTGGSHKATIDGTVYPTMEMQMLKIFADNIYIPDETLKLTYINCDYIDILIQNGIYANNTILHEGGIPVIKEIQYMRLTPDGTINIDVKQTALLDCTIKNYYGMQTEIYSWNGSMNYVGGSIKGEFVTDLTSTRSGSASNPVDGFELEKNGHHLMCLLKPYGYARRQYLKDSPAGLTESYGKFYTWLITDLPLIGGDTLNYGCIYKITER